MTVRVPVRDYERVEVLIDGKVYVVRITRNRPQLVFSHLLSEE